MASEYGKAFDAWFAREGEARLDHDIAMGCDREALIMSLRLCWADAGVAVAGDILAKYRNPEEKP